MSFDPKKHTIRVQGNREYLPVSARLVWFRQEHPDWSIVTSPVEINLEKQYAIFSATIMNSEGKIMATGTKMENVKGFGDYLEKAETGAVGRALAMCGYGTQFAPELEEGGRFADAPQGPMGGNRFASRPNGTGFGNGNGNRPGPMRGNGAPNNNGFPRDEAPRPPAPMTVTEDENPFDLAASAPPPSRERAASAPGAPAPRPVAPPVRPAPAPPEAAAGARPTGGITRVREPERDYVDPGGSDEPESPDDPFAEEFAAAPPRPSRPAPAPPIAEAEPAGPPKPNPLAGNNCSVPGCKNVLTPSQMTMSQQKFGKPLCLLHQREATRPTDAL